MNEIRINIFRTELLQWKYPEWPALDRDERYRLLSNDLPDDRQKTTNVTCKELHRWLAQVINPEINTNDWVADLQLGDGGTSVNSADTTLNNKLGTVPVSDSEYVEADKESHFNIFIDSTVLNGNTLNELGLVSDKGRFLNHAGISPSVDKTLSKTLIIEVILQFQA